MVSSSQAKVLMLIACIFGVLQGLITFLGGCVATYDKSGDAEVEFLRDYLGDGKYDCGFIRLKRVPDNVDSRDANCNRDFGSMDRGWYSRVHKFCMECYGAECDKQACKLSGFGVVLAYAIVCGAGWFLAAVGGIIGLLLNHRITGIVASISFIVFYIIFFGLFGAAWTSVVKFDKECLDKACKQVKKQGQRSSREVLAYSVCSFITILVAIVCSLIGAFSLGKSSKNSNEGNENDIDVNAKELISVKDLKDNGKAYFAADDGKSSSKGDRVTVVGREYVYKFRQLNDYVGDSSKLRRYAGKKFVEMDKGETGALEVSEAEGLVAELLQKKGLPAPTNDRVEALMRRYVSNENNKLDKTEFEQLLFDVFVESRELLIAKYAVKKANSWKLTKAPSTAPSEAKDLDQLVDSSENFYEALEEAAKQAGKNTGLALGVDEVEEVVKALCEKYKAPALNKEDILEIAHDLGKETSEYEINDLRMVVYAVLCVSRELLN